MIGAVIFLICNSLFNLQDRYWNEEFPSGRLAARSQQTTLYCENGAMRVQVGFQSNHYYKDPVATTPMLCKKSGWHKQLTKIQKLLIPL